MASVPQTNQQQYVGETWLARAYTLNWEVIAYTMIFVVAFISRFWDLGARVMSHDESLHTYYSWRLYDAGDFQHTPLMHGPLLFHANAFFYFLFGDNDFSGRIYTAILGIALVMFPILFRRWLGAKGAVIASIGILISPMMLYYSRYIRHDIPSIFFAVTMIYCFLQYMNAERTRRPVYLWIFAGAMVLLMASKEVSFMYIAIFGSFLTFYWVLRLLQDAGIKPRPIYDNTWQPADWQITFGHLLVAGAALLLGYFSGELLYYWQFAEVGYNWIIVGLGLALFAWVLPQFYMFVRRSLTQDNSQYIINALLSFTILVASLLVMAGMVSYTNYDSEIDTLTSTINNSVMDIGELEAAQAERAQLQDSRQYAQIAFIAGILVSVFGVFALSFTQRVQDSAPHQTVWMMNLIRILSLSVAIVLGLRLLTFLSIDPDTTVIAGIGQDYIANIIAIFVLFIAFESIGFIRTLSAGAPRPGLALMFTSGLARTKSASLLIVAGTVIGALVAVYVFGVLDIIKPDRVWQTVELIDPDAPPVTDLETQTAQPATVQRIDVDYRLGNALLLWLAIPLVISVVLVIGVALVVTPIHFSLPWQDIWGVLFVALIVGSVLIYVERHSLETTDEATEEPVAVDPNTGETVENDDGYNVGLIIATATAFLILTGGIVAWRMFYPHHWVYLKRQSSFDVLILMGTLTLPWLTALPIFLAGYTLDAAPLPGDTERVIIVVTGASLILTAAIGLAWSPKVWLIANAIFLSLFVFFFTTVFTNGHGIFTGMVGSLGYWLEQQGVRRGSQPQYYYTLIQIPIYEYLPVVITAFGGVASLTQLFRLRNNSLQAEAELALAGQLADEAEAELSESERHPTERLDMDEILQEQPELAAVKIQQNAETDSATTQAATVDYDDAGHIPPQPEQKIIGEYLDEYETDKGFDADAFIADNPPPVMGSNGDDGHHSTPYWARPYTDEEEYAMREQNPEWLGAFPFLQFVAYWAMIMLIALTVAGEKMPWLTTHITYPLILLGGWYMGKIIDRISWKSVVNGGWALLFFLLPVLMVATVRVFAPVMGGTAPFQGQSTAQLSETNEWIASLLVFLAAGYFVFRLGRDVGRQQLQRLAFASLGILLAVLTTRASWLASFQNYDLATEFLVYAHAAPAISTTMEDIRYFAERTNEGDDFRVAYDDDTSWPMTWYMRDYNGAFFAGDGESLENNPGILDDAKIVVVGSRKNSAVERILGDEYYAFEYIRLWWPMQEYFNLTYDRVANIFQGDEDNPVASMYRDGMWDIWWSRDYDTYAQAQCVEGQLFECNERDDYNACFQEQVNSCSGNDRYDLNNWPVADKMWVYVDREIAAQIWDAGVGGETVEVREPQSLIDLVYQDIAPLTILGEDAFLNNPRGIDVDSNGNVYVADTSNNRIVVFNAEGTLLQVIGAPAVDDNPEAPGTFEQPWGVEIASNGNIVVVDTWNHRIQVLSPSGEPITDFGSYGLPEDAGNTIAMYGPRDVELDIDGNILVADTGGKRIRVYSPDGEWLKDIGVGGSGLGQLEEPVGLAVNPINGEIYVADTWNQRIQVFTAEGQAVRQWPVDMWYDSRTSPNRPYIAISPDGSLLAVSDMDAEGRNDGPRIVVYDLAGNVVLAFNAPEEDFAEGLHGIRVVAGLEFNADGELYVVDAETARVIKFPVLPVTGSLAPVPATGDNSGGAGAGAAGNDLNQSNNFGNPIAPPADLPPSLDDVNGISEDVPSWLSPGD